MTPWAEKKVGDLIDGLVAGVSVRSRDGDPSRPAVLKTSAVANGRVDFRETKAIVATDVLRAKCAPVRDSIVISRMNTPALVGAVGYVETDEPGVFLPDRLWLARSRRTASTDMRWLNYALGFGGVATSVRGLATGTSNSMKNIPKSRLLELSLLVPSPEEQRAISAMLVDVDELIVSLEHLIAKKRAIKQGMMQELLTGRTRLPGFDKQWESKRIGDLLSYQQPGRYLVSSTDYVDAGTPVLTAGKTFVLGFTNETSGIYESLPVIIFDDFTTASKYVDFPFKAKSSAMKILSSTTDADLRFMFERMQAIDFVAVDHKRRWIAEYSKIEVAVPDIAEQRAIARVAADADAEIEALERLLEATRDIKQGMMQELLTGRTRLPAYEEVAV